MGFRSGAYATVFGVEKGNGNYYTVRLAISKKERNSGNYVTDFSSNFVRFIGDATNIVSRYAGKDSKSNGNKPLCRIKLGQIDVTTTFKDGNTYTNYVVFTCEDASSSSGSKTTNTKKNDYNEVLKHVESMPADEEELFT